MSDYNRHREGCQFKFAPLDVCDCAMKNRDEEIERLTLERDGWVRVVGEVLSALPLQDTISAIRRLASIKTTIRVNAMRHGASEEQVERLLTGEESFVDWMVENVETYMTRSAKRQGYEQGVREAAEIAESKVHSGTGETAAVHIRALLDQKDQTDD